MTFGKIAAALGGGAAADAAINVIINPQGAQAGAAQVTTSLKGMRSAAQQAKGSMGELERTFERARRAAGLLVAALATGKIIQYADSWKLIEARIGMVAKASADVAIIQRELFRIAQDTRTEYEAVATLYTRVARNAAELGRSQRDLLDFTETVQKALQVGGASSQEAASGVMQLSQALASGQLRGDEFRSMMENMTGVSQALAQGLGVTVGELREMALNGELSADTVVDGILRMKSAVDTEFAKVPVTVGQGFTVIRNSVMQYVGETDAAIGATERISAAMVAFGTDVVPKVLEGTNAFLGGIQLLYVDAAVGIEKILAKIKSAAASSLEVLGGALAMRPALQGLSEKAFNKAAELRQGLVGLDEALELYRQSEYDRITATRESTAVTLSDTDATDKRTKAIAKSAEELHKERDALAELVSAGHGSQLMLEELVDKQHQLTTAVLDGTSSYIERAAALGELVSMERALSAEWERQRNIRTAAGNARIDARYSGRYGDMQRTFDMGVNRPGGVVQAPLGFDPQQLYNEVTRGRGVDVEGAARGVLSEFAPAVTVNAIAQLIGSITDLGEAAEESAERVRGIRSSMQRVYAELAGDELRGRLNQIGEEGARLQDAIMEAIGDLDDPHRTRALEDIRRWTQMRERRARDEFAFEEASRAASLGSRSLRARGFGSAADEMDLIQRHGAELFEALKRSADAAELAAIAAVQAEERLAVTRQREAERLRQQLDFTGDIAARRAALGGDAEGASVIRFQMQQRQEITAAQGLYDAGVITIEMLQDLADVLNLELARAAENVRQQIEGQRIGFDYDILARRAAVGGDEVRAAEIRRIAAAASELEAARQLHEAGVITEEQLLELSDVLNLELAKAAKDAAQAIKDAAEAMAAAKRSFEQDIQYDWLNATGRGRDADIYQRTNQYESDVERAEKMGLSQEWLDKLKQTFDSDIAKIRAKYENPAGGMPDFRNPADRLPAEPGKAEVTRSVTGVTETTVFRLVDVAHAQLSVLHRIEANTRSKAAAPRQLTTDELDRMLGRAFENSARLAGRAP